MGKHRDRDEDISSSDKENEMLWKIIKKMKKKQKSRKARRRKYLRFCMFFL